ncbi:MAG: long-chain fatty acid--CoA ligase [Planctomycetes bacterium]|nr:long-chain fatty acid--CoA ligase [Planctomycetota bacterium]
MPMHSPVVEAFALRYRAEPTAPVAWTAAGWQSRADLAALAALATAALAGVPAGSRIALCVRDGFAFLAAVLAVWQHRSCAILLDAADPRAPRLDLASELGAAALLDGGPTFGLTSLPGALPAGDLAAIKLTSGTTARPRAVGVGFAELIADADALERTMGIGDADRVLAAVPMSFSYGVGNLLLPALWRGRVLVLPEARHPLGFLHALRQAGPTVLPAVPALLRALLADARPLPASLRLVVSAGAQLPPAVAAAFRARFGRAVHAFYGATEAGGICYDRTGAAAEAGSVGQPVDGVQVELDGDGRVVVRSPAVGRALEPDPDLADGTYRAPDLGAFRAGELVLLGRIGDSFDVGGHKVHPREVEAVIAGLDGVRDVAVVPWQDAAGRAAAAALVVATVADEVAVRQHCARALPAAKVPRCILFLPELPRDSRGKLPREAWQRLLAAAAPAGDPWRAP